MKTVITLSALVISLSAVFPANGNDSTEAELRRQIIKLKQKNASLSAGFIKQHQQIEQMREEIASLKQPATAATENINPELTSQSQGIWETELALGANLSRGNNDSQRVKAEIKSTRTTEVDRLTLALAAETGQNEGTTTAEYIDGEADYSRDIHERLYWYALLNGRRDAIADLEYRVTLSPGIGYTVVDEEAWDFSFEAGPAYVLEKLEEQDAENSLRGRLGQELHWQISSFAKLFQSSEFLINAQDTNDWIIEAEVGVETSITKSFSLRFGAKDTYDNQPAVDRVKNDIQLNTAIVYKFQ